MSKFIFLADANKLVNCQKCVTTSDCEWMKKKGTRKSDGFAEIVRTIRHSGGVFVFVSFLACLLPSIFFSSVQPIPLGGFCILFFCCCCCCLFWFLTRVKSGYFRCVFHVNHIWSYTKEAKQMNSTNSLQFCALLYSFLIWCVCSICLFFSLHWKWMRVCVCAVFFLLPIHSFLWRRLDEAIE